LIITVASIAATAATSYIFTVLFFRNIERKSLYNHIAARISQEIKRNKAPFYFAVSGRGNSNVSACTVMQKTSETEKQEQRSIGERLRLARKMAGLTQAQLAELTDLALRSIERYERAETPIDTRSLIRIAKATGVSVAWIISGSDVRSIAVLNTVEKLLSSFNQQQLELFCQQMESTAVNISRLF
jgi:transcriptional regulator with XRE-family HTH domain